MSPDWNQAVRQGDLADVERLLASGVDVNSLDRYGQTALMLAAKLGHTPIVERLIARGADLNHTAKSRLSALMLAVIFGREPIVKMLVAAGADTSVVGAGAPGFAGKTAADLARGRGDIDLAVLIERASREL